MFLTASSYTSPTITDYGTLEELTADPSMAAVGIGHAAQAGHPSAPTPPGGGSGGVGTVNTHGVTPGVTTPVDTGGNGGANTTPGSGVENVATAGGGGGNVPSTGSGGAGGKLPFTGFPVAIAASLGAGLVAAGAGLRRVVQRVR